MPRSYPRRRADPPPSRWERLQHRLRRFGATTAAVVVWLVAVLAGAGALVAATVPAGPAWLGEAGATVVATAYTVALAFRTGGRPIVFGALALAIGGLVLVTDVDRLHTGAAVLTCVVTAVLGVVVTVPAARFREAVRECLVATGVAAVGALAVAGLEPVVVLVRFEYVTLALALLGALAVVHRLGAGLHGLGRRGLLTLVVGTTLLAAILAYAELLRRYGTPGLVGTLEDVIGWHRDHLGASPRPLMALVGVPALVWGCHMRARRRQGWWVCAFGVAASTPAASALVNPTLSLLEAGLSVLYGLLGGLVLGYLVIRTDLALTGPRGRRSRRAEEAQAVRPEPHRVRPLL